MKKITSLLVATILLITTTQAQIQRSKPVKSAADSVAVTATDATPAMVNEMPEKASRKDKRAMMKELNLSRTQLKQLKGMRQDAKAKKDAIESNTQLSEEEKKKQTKMVKLEQLKKMKEILSPEQIQKLKEMRKQKAGDKMEMDDLEIE
jgi:Spy/CpxP family protein refolding chaperone